MIIGQEIDARKFTWTGKDGIADLSDLNESAVFGRLYDDAADMGFVAVNPKTGTKRPFYFHATENVNDVKVWIFKSVYGEFTIKIVDD